MIDVHIHVVPPNLPGVGSLNSLLRENPHTIAARLRDEMRASGVDSICAMGEWNCTVTDPLGIASTIQLAELVPGMRPIGIMDPVLGSDRDHLQRVDTELSRGRVVALKGYLGYLHFEPGHANYRLYYEMAAKHTRAQLRSQLLARNILHAQCTVY